MNWDVWARRAFAGGSLGVMLFSGCGMVPHACTEIGCTSGVTFELGAQSALFELDQPVQVRACIESDCTVDTVTATTGGSGFFSSTQGHFELDLMNDRLIYRTQNAQIGEGPKTVSLELTREGTAVLDEARANVIFDRLQPNGPGCEPVCWNTTVTL